MNKLELLVAYVQQHQQLLPAGLEICRMFLIFKPEHIYPVLKDFSNLYGAAFPSGTDINLIRSIHSIFQQRFENAHLPTENALLRTISEDKKYVHTKVGEQIEKNLEYANSPKKKEEIKQLLEKGTPWDAQAKLLQKINDMDPKNSSIPQEKLDKFHQMVEENWQDKVHVKADMDKIFQEIQNYYEIFRYIVGLLLLFFDLIHKKFVDDLESAYFSPELNVVSNLYKYSNGWKQHAYNYRKGLPSLHEYLNQSPEYKGLLDLFQRIFHKSEVKKYRIAEAHHMMDVPQDRLETREYAIYTRTGVEYATFDDLYRCRNDLYTLIQIFKWQFLVMNLVSEVKQLLDDLGFKEPYV